jgi:hypothetical protein
LELELEEEESYNKNIFVSLFYVFFFIGVAYQGKDIVFRFIVEYSSLRDFHKPLGNNNNSSIFI